VQQVAVAMYYASVVDNVMDPCFLLSHETNESPRKNAPPLVLFLSSKQFARLHMNKQLTGNSDF
jgi:hypothetical protein